MEETLKRAIDQYGMDNQIEMVIEECAELILSIQKFKRAKYSIYRGCIPIGRSRNDMKIYHNMCSEVADVKIMIEQMEIMLSKETIDICVERKIKRLEDRLNKSVTPL